MSPSLRFLEDIDREGFGGRELRKALRDAVAEFNALGKVWA
jgi:hypothetical protein